MSTVTESALLTPKQQAAIFSSFKKEMNKSEVITIPSWIFNCLEKGTERKHVDFLFNHFMKYGPRCVERSFVKALRIIKHPNLSPELMSSWSKYMEFFPAKGLKRGFQTTPDTREMMMIAYLSGLHQDEILAALETHNMVSSDISFEIHMFLEYAPNPEKMYQKITAMGYRPNIVSVLSNRHLSTGTFADALCKGGIFADVDPDELELEAHIEESLVGRFSDQFRKENHKYNLSVQGYTKNYINYLYQIHADILGKDGNVLPRDWAMKMLSVFYQGDDLRSRMFQAMMKNNPIK